MKGNYNNVATFYDQLSTVIFGNAILNAQKFLLKAVTSGCSVLIVGGGTGWILEELAKQHSSGLKITYVDCSSKMIRLSHKRNIGDNEVMFLHADIRDVAFAGAYDVVITPFVLDNFSAISVKTVFDKIDKILVAGGLWLFSDFRVSDQSIFWQKTLLKAMYYFFKICCNIEADRLPETDKLFNNYGYLSVGSKTFFRDFICSIVYKKRDRE
jgi:ubiquinone/menaquinone biosynthesis C-methylase UbiE